MLCLITLAKTAIQLGLIPRRILAKSPRFCEGPKKSMSA
jgi:hypothetical protein